MSDDVVILKETGSPKKRLRLSLQEYNGQPLLNIRYYFQNKDGEMQATTKGISVSRNHFLDIYTALDENHEEISDFLDNSAFNGSLSHWHKNKKSALGSVGSVKTIDCDVKPVPGKDFAEVSYEGSRAKVSLNGRHAYIQHCSENLEKLDILKSIAVAFDLSQKLISEEESNEVQHALERFKTEFSRQLRNLPTSE